MLEGTLQELKDSFVLFSGETFAGEKFSRCFRPDVPGEEPQGGEAACEKLKGLENMTMT